MHVLYVAWGFPPHRGPGTYRALASVDHLISRGHDVTVLTADLDYFRVVAGSDESLLERIDPRARVVRVPFAPLHRDPVINRWPRRRAEFPKAWRDAMLAREREVFPENQYALWRPRVEAAAYRVQREHPVDLVIATGNPYVDFVVPMMLNAEFGTPYVLDDRDSWVLNVYTGEPYPDSAVQQSWLEHLLDGCLETWFVNPPIAEWHRRRYPTHAGKIVVVENGWDAMFVDPRRLVHEARPSLVFGFLGTINAGLPLEQIIEGWRAARRRGLPTDAELRLYGALGHVRASRHQELLLQSAADANVVHMGRWPKTRIEEAYRDIDVLVFAKEGGRMVTSGKVYEYVATGKPIVGVVEAEHDARRVLADYPRVHLGTGASSESWAEVFLAGSRDAAEADPETRERAVRAGGAFRRDRILGPALDRVLADVEASR
jgi:glycosyltransferase involved in cell wall biosynthesis